MSPEARIRALPIWSGEPVLEPVTTGRTNRNFIVRDGKVHRFARVGADLPHHGIRRAVEARCAALAAEHGIAPPVRHAAAGILVTDCVEGRTLRAADAASPATLERIGRLLRRLHEAAAPADLPVFDPAAVARRYLDRLPADRLTQARRGRVLELLDAAPASRTSAMIHADPIPENFIDDGERLWLVDWEYSGSGEPAVDLAMVTMNFDLSPLQRATLLEAHGGADPGRVRDFEPAVAVREALWALAQIQHAEPVGDLVEYSRLCWERIERL